MTTTSDFDINMPSFDVQPSGSGDSFHDNNNAQYDPYNTDNWGFEGAGTSNWMNSDAEFGWLGYDKDDLWASDQELNQIFDPSLPDTNGGGEDSGFWNGVWDFVSSDKMLNALGGMANLGLDMWKASLNKPPAYTPRPSGGGSGGKTIHAKDAGKLTEKPLTFTRK